MPQSEQRNPNQLIVNAAQSTTLSSSELKKARAAAATKKTTANKSTSTLAVTPAVGQQIVTELKTKTSAAAVTDFKGNVEDGFKAYKAALDKYDAQKAIVDVAYSRKDLGLWDSAKTRFSSLWNGRVFLRPKTTSTKLTLVSRAGQFIRSSNELTKYEKAFERATLENDKAPGSAEAKDAEKKLTDAQKELVDAHVKYLGDARADMQAVLNGIKAADTTGENKNTIAILENLAKIGDKFLALEKEQESNIDAARLKIAIWHGKQEYKRVTPSIVDIGTPYDELVTITTEIQDQIKKLKKDLKDLKSELRSIQHQIVQDLGGKPEPSKAAKEVLEQAKKRIDGQISSMERDIGYFEEELKELRKVPENILQEKTKTQAEIYNQTKSFPEKAYSNTKEFFTTPTTAKMTGAAALGGVGVGASLYTFAGVSVANVTSTLIGGALIISFPWGGAIAAAVGATCYLAWNYIPEGFYLLKDKVAGREFADRHGNQVLMARLKDGTYLARIVDDKGNATGIRTGGGNIFQTSADRRRLVQKFIADLLKEGIIEINPPNNVLDMEEIPTGKHYEEYCALLVEECKIYGIVLQGEAIKMPLKQFDNKEDKENKFIKAQKEVQTVIAKERIEHAQGQDPKDPKIEHAFAVAHLAENIGELKALELIGAAPPDANTNKSSSIFSAGVMGVPRIENDPNDPSVTSHSNSSVKKIK